MCFIFSMFFFKPACGSIEKTQKKVPRKSTRSKIALSGCQSSLQLRKKKVKKRQETAFTESKDAAVPVWAAEIMIFWVFCTFGKKGESNMCSCCFLIMPSPTFAIGIFNRDMIEFQLTTPTLMSNV